MATSGVDRRTEDARDQGTVMSGRIAPDENPTGLECIRLNTPFEQASHMPGIKMKMKATVR